MLLLNKLELFLACSQRKCEPVLCQCRYIIDSSDTLCINSAGHSYHSSNLEGFVFVVLYELIEVFCEARLWG